MTFWQKYGWWLPLLLITMLAGGVMAYNRTETAKTAETAAIAEPILIIDAGHGGADGGAVAADGTLESGINLAIAQKLEALAAFWGLETVMTRQSEDISYPAEAASISAMKKADQNARLRLIHETPGAVLLSIHQNYYPSSAPWGPQVFYGREQGSELLAVTIQSALTGQLAPGNRRVAAPVDDGVYLMKNASVPAVLVECGFLSHSEELSKLKSEDYQRQLAAIFLGSWLQYIRGITA